MNKNNGIIRTIIVSFPAIAICAGAYCSYQSAYGDYGTDSKIRDFLHTIGGAILAGGFFAVILKYMQFMKIFKDELVEVIYEATYLENRKDLPDIWDKVSRVLFHDKFPKISNAIMNDVKGVYFPTDHVEYYDDYQQTIEVELIDPVEQKVKVTQTSSYIVYPKHDKESIPHKSINTMLFDKSKDEVSFKVIGYKVNGEPMTPTVTQKIEGSSLVTTYLVNLLNNKPEYKFETVVEKIYSLKHDCVIGQAKEYIINNLTVLIHLKGNIGIDFYSIGTLKKFTKKSKLKDKNYNEYEYKGLIYPKQGYFIIVKMT